MGEHKRMLSENVLFMRKFMELPAEAIVLYVYLLLVADDDGITNFAFVNSTLKYVGKDFSSQLRILEDKELIYPLNEYECTYFITHFRIQNNISSNQYSPSVHFGDLQKRYPELAAIVHQPKKNKGDKKNDKRQGLEIISCLADNKKSKKEYIVGVPEDTRQMFK